MEEKVQGEENEKQDSSAEQPTELNPEDIIKFNFPLRLKRLQKEYKRLDIFWELNNWSNKLTTWSAKNKKEKSLSSNPEILYASFKRWLKGSKPRVFNS